MEFLRVLLAFYSGRTQLPSKVTQHARQGACVFRAGCLNTPGRVHACTRQGTSIHPAGCMRVPGRVHASTGQGTSTGYVRVPGWSFSKPRGLLPSESWSLCRFSASFAFKPIWRFCRYICALADVASQPKISKTRGILHSSFDIFRPLASLRLPSNQNSQTPAHHVRHQSRQR